MKALWTLNPYFWRYKWLLLSGVLFVLLSAAFSVFPAVYIREAFDEVAAAISGQGTPGCPAKPRSQAGFDALFCLDFGLKCPQMPLYVFDAPNPDRDVAPH